MVLTEWGCDIRQIDTCLAYSEHYIHVAHCCLTCQTLNFLRQGR